MRVSGLQKIAASAALICSVVVGNIAAATEKRTANLFPSPVFIKMSEPIPSPTLSKSVLQEFAKIQQEQSAPDLERLKKTLEANIKPLNLNGEVCQILMKGVENEFALLSDPNHAENAEFLLNEFSKGRTQAHKLWGYLLNKEKNNKNPRLQKLNQCVTDVLGSLGKAYKEIIDKKKEYFPPQQENEEVFFAKIPTMPGQEVQRIGRMPE